jgi:hypothetical protein
LKRWRQFMGLAGLLVLLAPLLAAQETHISREGSRWAQEMTGSLAGVKILRVKLDMGSVVLRGGSQQNIDYVIHTRSYSSSENEARKQFEAYKISAYVKGDTAWIVGDWHGRQPHHFSGEFRINVPREMEVVKLETDGGSIDASGIAGKLAAESGGGGIHVDDIGGTVSADTGGGPIEAGTVGGDLELHTGGGSIDVHHANGKIVAETGGGGINILSSAQDAILETGGGGIAIRQCSGKVKASTGGGSITLGDIAGGAEVDTGGGNIHLASAKGHVRAESGGGGIELWGVPSARVETGSGGITVKLLNTGSERHDSELETSAGDIIVYIANDMAITVRANVDLGNGHSIHSDFSDIHVSSEGGQYGPKTLTAEGRLNGGGPVLKVRTTTGDICIRKVNQ